VFDVYFVLSLNQNYLRLLYFTVYPWYVSYTVVLGIDA
jgi:hypothetical protein